MARSRHMWRVRRALLLLLFLSILTGSTCREEKAEISEGLRQDAEVLRAVKGRIRGDPTEALGSWGVQSDPCRWNGVECDIVVVGEEQKAIETRVVGLDLWGLELEGSLAQEIGQLTELRRLLLVGNKFSGRITPEITNCRKLITLDLRANQFSGSIPFSLANFPQLEFLKLSENQLSGTLDPLFVERESSQQLCPRLEVLDVAKNWLRGSIPAEVGKCTQLIEVSLNDNGLGGKIPPTFGSLDHLRSLQLNANFLVGLLPSAIAGCHKLDLLDISENMLSGLIPQRFAQFVGEKRFNFSSNDFHGPIPKGKWAVHQMALAGAFSNNPGLCGMPLTKLCEIAANQDSNEESLVLTEESSSSRSGAQVSRSRSRRSMAEGDAPSSAPAASPPPAGSPPQRKEEKNHTARRWALGLALGIVAGALAAALVATVLRLCVFYLHKPAYLQGPVIFHPKIDPKMLVFLEKEEALPESKLIGAGGAGKVYKVQLEGGDMEVAVKAVIIRGDPKGEFGKKQIQAELETLGCIKHRNLVTLLAYVHRPDCHLLLYQYMKNGSLLDVLRRIESRELVMPWPLRHKIAVGTADGLAYLHFDCDPKIVHRDLKPPNILLDEDFVAHLADFGLAKVIPENDTHVSTAIAGTVGYIAPEYSQTCRFTFKSDVYSFGVVLAVLLTGKDPTDQFFHTIPGGNIGSWLRMMLQDGKGKEAIDPTLRNDEFDEEIVLAMKIAVFCTSDLPAERPSSKEILLMLRQIRVPEGDTSLSDRPSSGAPAAV